MNICVLCDVVYPGRCVPTFRPKLPPSSESTTLIRRYITATLHRVVS